MNVWKPARVAETNSDDDQFVRKVKLAIGLLVTVTFMLKVTDNTQ